MNSSLHGEHKAALETGQADLVALHFPGRKVLYVREVAQRLQATEQHVLNLIEEGKLVAINVGNGTRNFWRVPVTAFERYLKENCSAVTG